MPDCAFSLPLRAVWWHRIIDRKGFWLNGFINHYPDFMVMMQSGKLVLIEYKGDDRDNSDSERKLKLGRKRADKAGDNYRYFMVFKNREFGIDGAYTINRLVAAKVLSQVLPLKFRRPLFDGFLAPKIMEKESANRMERYLQTVQRAASE